MKAKTDVTTGTTQVILTKDEERKFFAVADMCKQWASIERPQPDSEDIHIIGQRLIDLVMCRRESSNAETAGGE